LAETASAADPRRSPSRASRSPARSRTPQLEKAESTFHKVSVVLLKWLARKADLAIDETIKAGIGVAKWSAVAALAGGLAAERAKLVSYILPF
jgi:hypothetical protein